MSVEVELTVYDYSVLLDWYVKAFGSKNDAELDDKKLQGKIAVMAQQCIDDNEFIEKMNKK